MADLRGLKNSVNEKRRLQQQETEIRNRISTMEALLPRLQTEVQREQEDVERMENGGFTSFLYSVMGRQEEKLQKERQEAYAAEVKYQDALRTIQGLHKELEDLRASLSSFGDVETRYKDAFSRQRQQLLGSNSPEGRHLRMLEDDARQLKGLQREALEAQQAGNRVMDQIAQIEHSLRSASNWGMVDMFSDSFISDMAKYGKMDEAQRELQELKILLDRYARELRDLDLHLNISADLGSGMRMADFFFDNIFTDSMALNRIDNIKRQVSQIRYQVEQHARIVENKVSSVETALSQKRREAEELIVRGETP